MVSQRSLVAYGLLVGMAVGMLYSAYESLHGVQLSSAKISSRGRTDLSERKGENGDSFLIRHGILAGVEPEEEETGEGGKGSHKYEADSVAVVETVEIVEPLPRVCGSPAVDGYAHVDPKCLDESPTAKAWRKLHAEGGSSGAGLACNKETAVSIDGLAVGWGIDNKKATPEDCCQACRDHVPGPAVGGPFGNLPCNVWVYCDAEECFEADAHHHTKGDCWLKFSEAPQFPEINARGRFPDDFKSRHPEAPDTCQWVSGVLLPPGQKWTNGTWGPRYSW